MSKRLISLLLTLSLTALLLCALVACNDTAYSPTDVGFTVSGKVTIDGTPTRNVKVLVDGGGDIVTDENGMFVVTGLDKNDVISFALDGYVFYPENHVVKGDVYDLRIEGFDDTSLDDDDEDTTSPTPDDSDGDDNDGNDGDDDGNDTGTNDDANQDDTIEDDKLYNVINAGLLFENNTINIVFCVENGFLSIVIGTTNTSISTQITVNEDDCVREFVEGDVTYLQFKVDVTESVLGNCIFDVSALNKQGKTGETARLEYTPTDVCITPAISLKGSILTLDDYDVDARHLLLINGVVVDKIYGGSIDLSAYYTRESGLVTIQVLSMKGGAIPAYSNQLTFTLESVDYDNQSI